MSTKYTEETQSAVSNIIRSRRSIYPASYNNEPITDAEIKHVLENANWAPTHKKTEPWRFRVLRGKALVRLGEFLATAYKVKTPEALFSELKYRKMQEKTVKSSCIIALYMNRDPKESLPEWEEVAAVSCAVQNMWLTCTALGIGAYWSTPSAFINSTDFLDVLPGERCLGLFYMGKCDQTDFPAKRASVEHKITWITE